MRASTAFLFALGALEHCASTHDYIPQIKIGEDHLEGWDVNLDPYKPVRSSKAVRATKSDSGFIDDVTCPEITCSVGNNPLPSQNVTAPVAAGGSIEILWNSCPLGYFGPVMNFLTKCPGTCSQYKGDDGDVWVKFQQETCANGTWASDNLANNHHSYTVNIPSRLEPGEYLLLHEILALHGGGNIGGARLYPVCIQLTITSNGTTSLPSAVALPGNYTLTDPGIHFSSYYGDATNQLYIAPGGPVISI